MKPDRLWFRCDRSPDCACCLIARFWRFLPLILLFILSLPVAASRLDFMLEDVRHSVFSIRSASIRLAGSSTPSLEINLKRVAIGRQLWRDLYLACSPVRITRESAVCDKGVLQIGGRPLVMAFRLSLLKKRFELEVQPVPVGKSKEKWRLVVNWQAGKWRSVLKIINGEGRYLADLAGLLPQMEEPIQVRQATLNGDFCLSGDGASVTAFSARLNISNLAFSDTSGLHAGERISLQFDMDAQQSRHGWRWQSRLIWPEGEIFWQPFYFSGGAHQLTTGGTIKDGYIHLSQGEFNLAGIGKADFSAVFGIADQSWQQARIVARDLDLSTLFGNIIRPLAMETALAETEAAGRVDIDWHYPGGVDQSLVADLHNVSLTGTQGRFVVEGLDAHLPWDRNMKQDGWIRFSNARVMEIPLGETQIPIRTEGLQLSIPRAEIPILDGKMLIEHFLATRQNSGWRWQFNGLLSPVSMEKLTESLQIQPMYGTLSGAIPRMSYANSTVTIEGELVFGVFDGVVTVRDLVLTEPLSLTPHLAADIAMHHIDLDLLTHAYSFGNMQGRVDISIRDLELIDWEPVRFDAEITSSAGDYTRRISQAAIRNLIALGGGSAVTAIQQRFLGLFEQFGYAEIGWRCKLRGNICYMGGIESLTHDDSYMLIKGSGIPAINITGYNRKVDWHELLRRLKQAIESGTPVIH